ncbi:thioesterase superfamily protein [Paenibacillus sp. 32O-W]|uniref:PaaI family thioesterase n=1 Tax=Paenibacillus sp. 32O-W TaxID=1695218 RepID=UPI00072028B9|nr:PaaI family thioesterase [Paenibacillus sp. 32O-W]ALS30076.1 thioesterase superfamily protein [Paenibacillus sp. 32O-W]
MAGENWFVQQADQAGHLTRLAASAQSTFWGLLGCEIVQAKAGKATICLETREQHLNLIGIVHGGVIASLLDNAMGLAAMMAYPDDQIVTAQLGVHFLTSSRGGILVCEAEQIHRSARTLTMQGKVIGDDGELVAWGAGAFRRKAKKE